MALLGMNIVVSKVGVQHFPPILFAALRLLALMPLACLVSRPQTSFKTLMLVSIFWAMLYGVGINLALFSGVSAGTAVLMTQASTFFSILLAGIFLNERPKMQHWIGVLIGFIGLYLVCSSQGLTGNIFGCFALLMSAISFSFGALLIKKAKPDPLAMMLWMAAIAALPVLCVSSYWEGNPIEYIKSASLFDWSTVFFAGWASMLLGGACWMFMLNAYEMGAIMPFRLLIPVFGCLFAYLLLGESYPFSTVVGGGIIMLGLAVTQVKVEWLRTVVRRGTYS